jgi:hypothetical protein
MLWSVVPDIPAPVLAEELGGIGVVLAIGVFIVEAIVLWLAAWSGPSRSALASLLMNVVTSIVGFAFLNWDARQVWLFVVVTWALSVIIEAGVLMLLKRGAFVENVRASLIANVASYALIVMPGLWLMGVAG